MCYGFNFTRINQKRKDLITSIFVRIGSINAGQERLAGVAGGGIQRNSNLDIGQNKKQTGACTLQKD